MTSPLDVGLLDPATGAAAAVVGDEAVLRAMVDVEAALLAAVLGDERSADADAAVARWREPGVLDVAALAAAGRSGGNAVIPLVQTLRRAAPEHVRDAVHLGLTSQDVQDSALMLVAARTLDAAGGDVLRVLDGLARHADAHRCTPVAGRTLGQQAAPTTAGLRFAVLLDGVTRAWRHLDGLELPLQLGGSVGTLAVLADVLGPERADAVRRDVAARLGLAARPGVWHVERGPVAELGAALAVLVGALGRLGLEVAQGARTELGELDLALGEGEGGSSAMPQKHNPVAAVLLVAHARRAPGLAATLLGAMLAPDDRPPGDWHAEWQPLRELLRLALESAALAAQVVETLEVDAERMRAHLDASRGAVHAERAQWALVPAVGRTRAAELVRDALAADDFVPALLAAAPADAADRIRSVTSLGGAVGLSDDLVDAAIRAARSAA